MSEINIEEGIKFFGQVIRKYVKAADFAVAENLHMKKEHSERVSARCKQLAAAINLEPDEQDFAGLAGLLHDVGRFAQFEKYKSFDDSQTEDHAALSVSMIQEADFFKAMNEYDQQVLLQSVGNHNKLTFTANDKKTALMGQILRDADKLDNWELAVSLLKRDGSFGLTGVHYNLPKIPGVTDAVIKSLAAGKCVNKKDLHSLTDFKLFLMSMVYDLNFKASFAVVSDKQLIRKLYDSLSKRDDIIDAYRVMRLFVENKLTGKERA